MSQFCLRWNNHQPNFISVFTNLLNTESLVDVTLAAEGKQLQAHKVVLSACSVYFQTLFTSNPSRHPIVIIKDVSFSDLRVLVDFMYYGEVNVTEEQLPRILDTARLLKIKGLTEMPDSTKHSSPPTAVEPASPERRQANKETDTSAVEWENSASPSGKRKRDEMVPALECGKEQPAIHTGVQFRQVQGVFTMPQRTQEPEENGMRGQHIAFQPQMDQHGAYNAQEQNNLTGRLMGPIPGIQWTTPSFAPTEQPMERQDANAFPAPEQADATHNEIATGNPYDIYNDIATQSGAEPTQQRPVEGVAKRRRTVNPQAAENFQRAIEAVRFGGIGFCKAARIFGVNNRTLWLEYKKKGYPIHRPSIRERIKREPDVEPAPEVAAESEPAPAGYVLNQTCYQYLQDSSLQGF